MKITNWYFNHTCEDEFRFLFGFVVGRINGYPESLWMWSVRLYLGLVKIEIILLTGKPESLEEF